MFFPLLTEKFKLPCGAHGAVVVPLIAADHSAADSMERKKKAQVFPNQAGILYNSAPSHPSSFSTRGVVPPYNSK